MPLRPSTSLPAAGLALLMGLLGACAVGPDFVRPAAPNVDRYTSRPQPVATVAADGQAQSFVPGAAVAADWWQLFHSATLDALVRRALANNPTLEAAEASLRQSQDQLRARQGIFSPQVSAGLAARREATAPAQPGSPAAGAIFNLMTLSASISYSLDVFGGERRAVEGLRAQVDQRFFERQAADLTLTANVVDAAIASAAYAAQIQATLALIELERVQLHAVEAQVQAGTTPYPALLSRRSALAAHQGALAPLRQKLSQAEHLLAALEGLTPAEATPPDLDLAALSLPARLPLSVPSDLVRQRPDILAAEAQLRMAGAEIGIATAAMFPSFSLNGTFGTTGSGARGLLSAGGRFWNVGPSANLPLFQGGSLWFGRQAAIDAFQQSQAGYRQTVLAAFTQVADSLTALEQDAAALATQVEARQNAAEILRLRQANCQAGLVAGLDVLDADVQWHQTTITYLQAVAQRQQDTVALFVALGGGWWNRPSPAPGGRSP